MYRKVLLLMMTVCWWPIQAGAAATTEHFKVPTAQDLAELCSVSQDDPLRVAAIHFCEGYLVGAYHYYRSLVVGSGGKIKPFVCFPNPEPTRDEVVQQFVGWLRINPRYQSEMPVNALFKFAAETWPCKK
jgi:hypothetical protein